MSAVRGHGYHLGAELGHPLVDGPWDVTADEHFDCHLVASGLPQLGLIGEIPLRAGGLFGMGGDVDQY